MSVKCPRCGETDITKFGKNASRKNGVQRLCKVCINAANLASYASHREERQAYQREYVRTHHEQIVDGVRRFRQRRLEDTLATIAEEGAEA